MKRYYILLVMITVVLAGRPLAWAETEPDSKSLSEVERLELGVSAYEKKNWVEAARWLMPLAVGGEREAQWRIGEMYTHGWHFAENRCLATVWHDKAARQGHANSAARLGFAYEAGWGVREDPVEAYRWMLWALDNGSTWDREGALTFVTWQLRPTTMRRVEQSMDGWHPQEQPPIDFVIVPLTIYGNPEIARYLASAGFSSCNE